MHKSQLLFILLIAFIVGVTLASFWEIDLWVIKLLFVPPLLAIGLFWRRKWMVVFGGAAAIFFLFGFLRLGETRPTSTFVPHFAETNFKTTLYGYIDDQPQRHGQWQQFVFRVRRIKSLDYKIPEVIDEKVLVIADPFPSRRYGETLALTGKIKLPQNKDDFDYINYLAKEQIFTIMFRPETETTTLVFGWTEKLRLNFLGKILALKSRFEGSINRAVTEPAASFLNGILLGSRQNLPADLKAQFATVGLSHILAISGYNITIVAEAMMWFLLLFFRRATAFWFALGAILLFTLLTGASASVVRSALMGGLVLLANHSGRLYSSKNSLALAGFLMILANPMVLRYDVGFQLSFLATLGLIYLAPLLRPYFSTKGGSASGGKKWPGILNFKETFLMTVSAQIMVLPLLLYYFHNFSAVAILSNLAVLPFIPWAMAAGFAAGVAGMFWNYLGLAVGAAAWLIVSFVLALIKFFARLPGASWQVFISWPGVAFLYFVLLLGVIYLKKREKKQAKL